MYWRASWLNNLIWVTWESWSKTSSSFRTFYLNQFSENSAFVAELLCECKYLWRILYYLSYQLYVNIRHASWDIHYRIACVRMAINFYLNPHFLSIARFIASSFAVWTPLSNCASKILKIQVHNKQSFVSISCVFIKINLQTSTFDVLSTSQ